MNKKKLPKAIRPTADDAYQTSSFSETNDLHKAPARVFEAQEPKPDATGVGESVHLNKMPLTAPSRGRNVDHERRKSVARTIVERHATYSAVGGIIPLPIVNIASVTAVIVRMVKMLSDLYGVPFERDRARAIVVGLMGGSMPTGLGAATASTLIYVVPGSNLIGLAISSITAVACTRSIGRVFVEHFESGALLIDFPHMQAA
jgi:uncharacterized protein (DUF697 family)